MFAVGHVEVMIVVAMSFAIQIVGLVILGLQLHDSRKMVAESQRLTKAVGALVIQESDKIRHLFPL